MSAEKFVKSEAKKMLSLKWPVAILSTLELLFVPIIAAIIMMMAYSLLGETDNIIDTLSGLPVTAVLFVVFHIAAVLALILLSPAYTGFVRIFSGIADGKNVDPGDLFYFFDNKKRYKNAVKFMTGVIVKSFGILLLCNLVGIGFIVASQVDTGSDTGIIGGIAFIVIGTIIAFLCIHRFAFSVMLFSYYDYDPENAVKFGSNVAKGNTQKLINLTASFIGWLLLTFFVVPFVYIYPYMTCSYFVSVKYLIQQYKEQFGDIANSYADQNFRIDLGMENIPQADIAKNTITQIPPITEDRTRASHFPPKNDSETENTVDDSTAPTVVLDKPDVKEEYSLENFEEKKSSDTEDGTVDEK